MSFLDEMAALEGMRVPGGCDDCSAYQTVDASQAPIYRINIHHDESCPAYQAVLQDRR